MIRNNHLNITEARMKGAWVQGWDFELSIVNKYVHCMKFSPRPNSVYMTFIFHYLVNDEFV